LTVCVLKQKFLFPGSHVLFFMAAAIYLLVTADQST